MVDFHIFVQVHVNYAEFFFLNRILTDLDSVATSHCWILGLYDYIMHLAVFFGVSAHRFTVFFSGTPVLSRRKAVAFVKTEGWVRVGFC